MHQHRHIFGNLALCRYQWQSQMGPSLSRPGVRSVTVRDSSYRCEANSHHYLTAPLGQVIASSPRDHRLQHGRRPPFKPLRASIIVTDTEAQPQNDILDFDLSLTCLCLWKKSSDKFTSKVFLIQTYYYAHTDGQQANILLFNNFKKNEKVKINIR